MTNSKLKTVFFSIAFFVVFWMGFRVVWGGLLGGVLELFFATWGYYFQFAWTFLDLLSFWKEKLLKFTRCCGLEALEGHFCIHFGGTWLEKGWILSGFEWKSISNLRMRCATCIKVEQYIEFANGVHNLHQGANGAHTGKQKSPRFPFPPLFRFWPPGLPQRMKDP